MARMYCSCGHLLSVIKDCEVVNNVQYLLFIVILRSVLFMAFARLTFVS